MAVTQYIGARYVPLFADPLEWNDTRTYEPLTIVLHKGSSYTSRQFVPLGTDIDNTDYWALTGNYNAQVEQYRQETKDAVVQVDALITKAEVDVTQRLADNESAMNALDNSVKTRLTENETTVSQRLADNKSAMNALDSSVKTRLTENETAMTALDNSVKSRLTENENTVSQRLTENETAVTTAIDTALKTVSGVTDVVGAVWALCDTRSLPPTVIAPNITNTMSMFIGTKFGSDSHDIADYVTLSTNTATVVKAGMYRVSSHTLVTQSDASVSGTVVFALNVNDSALLADYESLLNLTRVNPYIAGVLNLKAGDVLKVTLKNDRDTGNITYYPNKVYTYLTLEYLGSAGE